MAIRIVHELQVVDIVKDAGEIAYVVAYGPLGLVLEVRRAPRFLGLLRRESGPA